MKEFVINPESWHFKCLNADSQHWYKEAPKWYKLSICDYAKDVFFGLLKILFFTFGKCFGTALAVFLVVGWFFLAAGAWGLSWIEIAQLNNTVSFTYGNLLLILSGVFGGLIVYVAGLVLVALLLIGLYTVLVEKVIPWIGRKIRKLLGPKKSKPKPVKPKEPSFLAQAFDSFRNKYCIPVRVK